MTSTAKIDSSVGRVVAPFFVAGQLQSGADVEHISRDQGEPFYTPALDLARIAPSRSVPAPAAKLKVGEVIDFLVEVGRRITPENPYLKEAVDAVAPIHTIPRSLLERSYAHMATVFDREELEIAVETDTGYEVLDGWKRVSGINGRENYVHAAPPRLVTVLAGNAPAVAALTIARGALMKGVHLLKMPSNDLFTTTAILRTMRDIEPDHPVVRSFSAVYWRGGDEKVESVLYRPNFFDKIVVWGGEAAVRHAQKYVGPGLQLVSWDPKTSISLIGREAFASEQTLREVAVLAATDATSMNQDACVASRYQYIEGTLEEADRYCELLIRELGVERELCSARSQPTPPEIRDEVNVLRHIEPAFRVWGDYSGAGLVVRSEEPVDFFPDCRTVNVVAVEDLSDAAKYANVATQTAGVYPDLRKKELRDRLADFGVQRIVSLGNANHVPPGMPHDGSYEMNRLVRWVSDEGPLC